MSKNNKVYTIYQTKNLINNKIYIGIHYTSNIHDGYLGSGKYLKKAIKKYGRENFKKTIICITKDWDVARKLERLYVDEEFIKRKDTYNVELGGIYNSEETRKRRSEYMKENNPFKGKHHSEESRRKMSEACKGRIISEETRKRRSEYMKENNPFKGKHHSEESRRKMSEACKGHIPWNKGKQHTEESKRKMSEAHKGKHHSEESRRKMSEACKGKHHSEETRKKLSEACKGRIISEEQRRKISKTLLGNIPWNKGKSKYSMCENMTLEEFNIYCKENNISPKTKEYIKYKFNINK